MTPERWQQVEEIFHEALSRGERDRVAFLVHACAGDVALRREVEALLAQQASGFLESPAVRAPGHTLIETSTPLTGRRLGAYQVHERIGVGGMGEVYRARDTKLGRDVAIKILPKLFTSDPDRLARFEREARVLASLNHPHIGAIYGLEDAGGVRALVLELVDGETLEDRIAHGPIHLNDTLTIARQIADALDAAHEKGIVHRDLKPANIKVTPEGVVKVLDFGLARIVSDNGGGAFDSRRPTITIEGTREGLVMGTAAYMSPEQARGKTVDKRTDIWAFGCVLYEMLSGRAAFARDTFTDTLAAVVEQHPLWTALPSATPSAILRLLRHCLEKDPKRRLRDIADASHELDDASNSSPIARAETTGRVRTLRAAVAVCAATAVAAAALAVWSLARDPGAVPRSAVRFAIQLEPDEDLSADSGLPRPLVISRDGKTLVYVVRRPAGNRVYVRRLADAESTPIAGAEGGIGPFISPDDEWVGFASGGFIKKVPMGGGIPQNIASVSTFLGASWGADDSIVYAEWGSGLFKVSGRGGTPQPLTTVNQEQGEIVHFVPEVLPGGNAALFAVRRRGTPTVEVVDIATGRRRSLLEGSNPHYVSSGHLVFTRGSMLHAVPFDLARLEAIGAIVPMSDQVRVDPQDRADFTVAADGTLVYVPAAANASRLVWLDKKGRSRPLVDEPRPFNHPRISPDGSRVVVQVIESGTSEFWIYDAERGTRLRLSSRGTRPIWAHDGTSITFGRDGSLHSLPADDSKGPELFLARDPPGSLFPLAWSSDGHTLVYSRAAPDTNRDVFTISPGGTPSPFLTTIRDERAAMLSPDSRWMVYAALETGREEEIYVQRYPGPGERVLVSQAGGREPVWSRAGNEIFYRSIDGQRMMSVEVRTEPSISLGRPRTLFQGRFREGTFWANYDVSRDGNQFLMLESANPLQSRLNVALHWIDTLKQRQ